MVTTLFQYLRMALFVSGVLFGIQFPGLVDQYGKALKARAQESLLSVQAFQDDADRYFHGDLQELVDHYAKSSDVVINHGGGSISSLVKRNLELRRAVDAFYENSISPYWQFTFRPLPEVRRQVVENYTYTVVLNSTAIGVGVLLAILVTLCFDGCCYLTHKGCSACVRKFSH